MCSCVLTREYSLTYDKYLARVRDATVSASNFFVKNYIPCVSRSFVRRFNRCVFLHFRFSGVPVAARLTELTYFRWLKSPFLLPFWLPLTEVIPMLHGNMGVSHAVRRLKTSRSRAKDSWCHYSALTVCFSHSNEQVNAVLLCSMQTVFLPNEIVSVLRPFNCSRFDALRIQQTTFACDAVVETLPR